MWKQLRTGRVRNGYLQYKIADNYTDAVKVNNVDELSDDFQKSTSVRQAVKSVIGTDDKYMVEKVDDEFVVPHEQPIGDQPAEEYNIENIKLTSDMKYRINEDLDLQVFINKWRTVNNVKSLIGSDRLPSRVEDELVNQMNGKDWIVEYSDEYEGFVITFNEPIEPYVVMDVYDTDEPEQILSRIENETDISMIEIIKSDKIIKSSETEDEFELSSRITVLKDCDSNIKNILFTKPAFTNVVDDLIYSFITFIVLIASDIGYGLILHLTTGFGGIDGFMVGIAGFIIGTAALIISVFLSIFAAFLLRFIIVIFHRLIYHATDTTFNYMDYKQRYEASFKIN